tara:strand:+ start:1284 stop:2036 length:753 start_codon:yes stop_codon:yes gene_type:complete
MKKLLLLFVFLTQANQIYGQVNIESIRNSKESKKPLWGEAKGGLELQRGNVEINSFDLDFLVHLKKNKNHIFLQSKTSQGKQNNIKFKNTSFLHLRWTWMFKRLLGLEIFTQLQHDQFKDLEIRQLNGCGIRSEVFNSKNLSLSIGSGAMHDFERLTSKEESGVIRSTSYITALKSFNKKNLVSFTIYYQPLFSNMNDYRINMESSIRTEFLSFWNIYLDNSINYLYDTKPPNNIETKDLIVKTSLVYSW